MAEGAESARTPLGVGLAGSLTHDVIHGLDVTVALGLDRRVPEDRLRVVLDVITTPKGLKSFGAQLDDVQLRAEEIDWTFGTGTPVFGAAQDLALVICGRRLPAGRLRGGPCARFTADGA
jgi:hypothetical protein